jgi:hypothetical protein
LRRRLTRHLISWRVGRSGGRGSMAKKASKKKVGDLKPKKGVSVKGGMAAK